MPFPTVFPATSPAVPGRASAPGLGRRRWALAGLTAAVLSAHLLLTGALPQAPTVAPAEAAPPATMALQVRQIPLVPTPAWQAPPPVQQAVQAAPRRATPVRAETPAMAAGPAAPLAEPVLPEATVSAAPVIVAAQAVVEVALAVAAVDAAVAVAVAEPVPVYKTRLPPPVRLLYDLTRSGLTGRGELVWRPAGERYEASLEGSALAMRLIGWSSQGALGTAGIAPERYVDKRRGRDAQAANFQRDKGLITYSGPAVQHPLVAGAQDRLSWMLQLPGIIAAEPAAYPPGAQVAMFVSGARGDGDVWHFSVVGVESVDVPAGRVAGAVRLKRESRKPYDTAVEVWLDPARSYLPVRVRLAAAQNGGTTEFLLRERQPL